MPARLFDVQIAAGLIGLEYPASYATLVRKLLGETPQKGETRTDWRRRPLSRGQLEYALVDVEHLHQLQAGLRERLARLDRTACFTSEMEAWQNEVAGARANDRWRRVAGSSGLPARGLAVVRELWAWREAEAERRDWPVRRVLRDDLITELAKRRSSEPKQIRAIRGMERGDLARSIGDLAKAIERALKLPDADCPRVVRTDTNSQLTMLGQFLTSALSSICRAALVAPSIVGTATDVRELVAYRLKEGNGDPNQLPILAQGWRAEVVGQMLDDLLAGEKVIRIRNPRSDEPLEIVPRGRP
jgi:ribonuclease D